MNKYLNMRPNLPIIIKLKSVVGFFGDELGPTNIARVGGA